jgi:hypothetical protein
VDLPEAPVRQADHGLPCGRPESTTPVGAGRSQLLSVGNRRFKDVARVRAEIEAEIDPALRQALRGQTDSERCFLLFLSRLAARCRLDRAGLDDVRAALAAATATLARLADPGADRPSSLNFLVSDGRLLAACRRGRDLHLAAGLGPQHAFVVASEPIGRAAWQVVPEGAFVGTDDGARVLRGRLLPR